MSVALAHRAGVHTSKSPEADADLLARISTDNRVVIGWGRDRVTLGTARYGWTITCIVCGEDTPRRITRREALDEFAAHLNGRSPGQTQGADHDHDNRCCAEHHTHTMPHRGCILR